MPLAEVRGAGSGEYGRKAATLGELAAVGFRVPPALIVSTSAYNQFLGSSGCRELVRDASLEAANATPARLGDLHRRVVSAFTSASLPADIAVPLDNWTAAAGTATFAVRSSATNEDLAGASFAGLYSSFLGVRREDVTGAVIRCFASLFNPACAAYRRRLGIADRGSMAVIVQEMIAAEQGGVVFTRAPRREECLLVENASGTGEAVVSGTAVPDRYYVNRRTLALDEGTDRHHAWRKTVGSLVRLCLDVERHLGAPQDIEYAIAADVIYLLQARPITTRTSPSLSRWPADARDTLSVP